jgi:threonine aldolase
MVMPPAPERSFASDNFSGVHPRYLDAISAANVGHAPAYGTDALTRRAETMLQDLFATEVDVLFTFNGTGANVVALGMILRPGDSVVCTNWSHINVDETGAPERILGAKLQDVHREDAKLRPDDLHSASLALGNVHHVQPRVVSLTQSTELGTLYTVEEIRLLCEAAHAHGLLVHLDGARLANAVAALGGGDETLRAMTFDAGVDAVSFGGTKNAMMGAEAVVIRSELAAGRGGLVRKSTTQLPSKQRYVAAQFVEALRDGLWLETAAHANAMARLLHDSLADLGELRLSPPAVNSLFPLLPAAAKAALQDWCFFWDWDPAVSQVRWMTSWDTTEEDIGRFAAGVRQVLTSP